MTSLEKFTAHPFEDQVETIPLQKKSEKNIKHGRRIGSRSVQKGMFSRVNNLNSANFFKLFFCAKRKLILSALIIGKI